MENSKGNPHKKKGKKILHESETMNKAYKRSIGITEEKKTRKWESAQGKNHINNPKGNQ